MKFKKAIALIVSALLTFMNMSNIVMAEEQQPITDGKQKINANKLDWTPVSRANQLGGADDFNGIIFNELKNFNESGGPVAAGKISDVKLIAFQKGLSGGPNKFEGIIIPQYNVGTIIQDSIGGSIATKINNGDAVVGEKVEHNKLQMGKEYGAGDIYKRQVEIDKFLSGAKNDFVNLNKSLWDREKTTEISYDEATITLNCVKGINVFEIDFTKLGGRSINFTYSDAIDESTIIIKVKGNVIDYKSTFLNGNQLWNINKDNIANRIMWVIDPDLKGKNIDIEMKGTQLWGSLLAPNANIVFTTGYSEVNGTIIANGLDGSGTSSELHWVGPFNGDIITPAENVGAFNFDKKDNHGNAVNGATFALYQGNEEKYTATSANNVSFSGIKPGEYILKETSAPNRYEISKAEVEVIVSNDGIVTLKENGVIKTEKDLELLYVNNIAKDNFSFKKVVAGTDKEIPNVEFKLMQGEDVIATAVSDEKGVVNFENIELGTYTLIETTPTGYKAAGPWTVNVAKEGAFIGENKLDKIENEKIVEKTGLFQFNKLDNRGNPVNGAKFALLQDGVEKYTTSSTDTGLVSFSGIKEGSYTLKETSAPNGYEISKAEVEVIVNNDGTVTFKESGIVKTSEDLELLYINKMILGSISFTKYINDKKGILTGAEFELLINGERYGSTVFSDVNGLVTFLDVKPGEYKIREVSSHSNYFKTSDKTVDVVIDKNGVSSLVGEEKIKVETIFINKVDNSIQFIKYSNSKSVLSNATFELLKGTEVIATSVSDKNGVVRFDNILPGEYIVREKSAPKGYIKSDATRKLVVKDNGEISITASEIKEWEEAFKNKKVVGAKEEKPNKKEEIRIPQTSDDANVIFPLIMIIISLAGIVFIKRIKH